MITHRWTQTYDTKTEKKYKEFNKNKAHKLLIKKIIRVKTGTY